MKLKGKNKLLLFGVFVSFVIIYLTKIDKHPAAYQWMYDIGQYLWFNLAISYLGSIIFYIIVVFIPEERKRKLFQFQKTWDIQKIIFKAHRLYMHLRNAAEMQHEIENPGKTTIDDIKKMVEIVDLDGIYNFVNEPGPRSKVFREYFAKFQIEIKDLINNALTIPYDDSVLNLHLISLHRCPILTLEWLEKDQKKIPEIDILMFFALQKILESYYDKHLAPDFYALPKNKKYLKSRLHRTIKVFRKKQ